MFDLNKLMDLGESFATYLVLGAAAIICGLVVENFGGWFAESSMHAIGNLLTSPGRVLFLTGFVAAGVAGDMLPSSVRTTCFIVAGALLLRIVIAGSAASHVASRMMF